MDEDLYDEFGNYKGPEIEDSAESGSDEFEQDDIVEPDAPDAPGSPMQEEPTTSTAIVLPEDKKYYPDAEEVFPMDTQVLVQEEDTQPLTEPIIKPLRHKAFRHLVDHEEWLPTTFSKEFMFTVSQNPDLIRCISLIGHLHHGKTTFAQMLLDQTHETLVNVHKNVRWTDTRFDEQERGISIKDSPLSLILPDTRDKSFLVHVMDTPGHVNFSDEVTAALRLSDGVVVIVDAIEGVMLNTDRLIRHAIQEGMALTLVINKIDRLILELKLPPGDSYYKIKHTLDSVNAIILEACGGDEEAAEPYRLSPDIGNVAFASGETGWCFTLTQFAQIYTNSTAGITPQKNQVAATEFAKRLWGNKYFDHDSRRFVSTQQTPTQQRSFVEFVLEPIYKLYAQILGEDSKDVEKLLKSLGIHLTKNEMKLDVRPLLKVAMNRFFGSATGFVDMITQFIPSPRIGAPKKIENTYTGPLNSPLALSMMKCDPAGPLVIHVSKLCPSTDSNTFQALGRVISGTLRMTDSVKVLGEKYSMEDEEDMTIQEVSGIHFGMSRYNIDMESVSAGNWVLIDGVDESIIKTATLISTRLRDDAYIFKPLRFNTLAVVKIAVEPLNPSELPKMLEGIRKVNKTYPLCSTKVEDSGEHTILGTGELYLDSLMYDLRKVFSEIEVKVSDPVVTFCETVVETSSLKCFAETPNKENKLTMVAQPLEKKLAEDIETGRVSIKWDQKRIRNFFQTNYEWDILAARNIWAFGPEINGPNILVNDCLPSEVNMNLLNTVRDDIVQGFQWATREGPLCEEPIRNVKFEIKHAVIAEEPILRGLQIIPTARRVAYSAFLTATPRLMEPIYVVEIISPPDTITAIYKVLARRRGHVVEEKKKEGSPLYTVKAFIPVIDSFGFETDLRAHSQGQAFCMSLFDHWAIVPGDPLDKTIILRPLEDAPTPHLARDFMVKTRRRKGLSEDVSRNKFFDEDLLARIEQMGIDINTYM